MKYTVFALASVGMAALAVPAAAQDAPAPAAQTAPAQAAEASTDIVVTARRREENLIDVPIPVTVATADQLKRDQIYNITDLQRVTPALEVSQTSGGETNGGGRLRGVGTGVFNPSVSPSVALVVDQVPVGNLAFPHLFDMAQVEVLRGPQGTLFGQGASAGVLNVTTVRPTTDRIKVSGGVDFADKGTAGSEVGELIVRGGFNLPLSDRAAIRISSQYKKETGLQRSATTGKDNKISDFGVRARAFLKPTDAITINLSGEYGQEDVDGQTFFAIAIAPTNAVSTAAFLNPTGCKMPVINERAEWYCEAQPTDMELKIAAVSAVIDFELSDAVTLTSVTGYRDRRFDQLSRDFSRILPQPAARQERTRENSDGFSQEVRLGYSSDALDLTVGGIYNDYHFDRVPMGSAPFTFGVNTPGNRIGFGVCVVSGVFCAVPTSFTKETTSNRTVAAFADMTYALSEQFEIFGGARYSDFSNTTRVGVNTLNPASTFKTEDSNVSGRIGASFKPNTNSNLYASYSRGYKPPAVGTNPAGALFQLKPETSDAFELGAKTRLDRLQLSGNIFYTKLQNFQSQTSVFVGTALVSQPLNVPKITSKGFEITAFGRVLPQLSVNAGYQFNDISFPSGYLGDDGGNLGGTQFLNAPKHKFTLSGDYGVPVSTGLEGFISANLIYKSKVLLAARADPRYRYPAHELINARIGLRHPDGQWSAAIFARNLTKSREPTAYLASTFAGAADGGIRAWPVAGLTARVVGISTDFNF